MGVVQHLQSSTEPISHRGKHHQFDDVSIRPQPVQRPIPAHVASFSQPSIELAARLGCGLIVAPFAVVMTYGGLREVSELYEQTSLNRVDYRAGGCAATSSISPTRA